MEFVLVGLTINAVIGGLLGHSLKDRAGAGLALGLLLGPIGWLAIIALEDNLRKCPKCRGRVEKDATICRHCQSELPAAPSPAPIGKVPWALRILGVLGFVITLFLTVATTQDRTSSDGDILLVASIGGGISFTLFGIGLFLSQRTIQNT